MQCKVGFSQLFLKKVTASILMIQGLELQNGMAVTGNILYQRNILSEIMMKNSFSERILQDRQVIWGKYGEKKTAVYLFLPSLGMATDLFQMQKKMMHFI